MDALDQLTQLLTASDIPTETAERILLLAGQHGRERYAKGFWIGAGMEDAQYHVVAIAGTAEQLLRA